MSAVSADTRPNDSLSDLNSHGRRKRNSALELPALEEIIRDEHKVQEQESTHAEPLLTQLVLTPMLMVSFLLSLFYVDHQQRTWRVAQSSQGHNSSRWNLFSLRTWLDPEPYRDPTNSTWGRTRDFVHPADQNSSVWSIRKKHRKTMNLEFSKAFEMRGRVTGILTVFCLLGFLCAFWTLKKLYGLAI